MMDADVLLVISLGVLRDRLYGVGSNVALAPLGVPFEVVVKGTVAWRKVLMTDVSPKLW